MVKRAWTPTVTGALALAAVALALPVLALAGVRHAGGRPIASGSADTAKTSCGEHKVASGGGFAARTGPDPAAATASAPAGAGAWKSRVVTNPGTSGSWRNFAVCVPLDSVSIATASKPIKKFGAFFSVDCPKRRTAVGGGWATRPPYDPSAPSSSFIYTVLSRGTSSGGSRVGALSNEETGGRAVAYAVCASAHVKEVTKKTDVDAVGRAGSIATCPPGTKLLSGGFDWFGFPGSLIASRPKGSTAWKPRLTPSISLTQMHS